MDLAEEGEPERENEEATQTILGALTCLPLFDELFLRMQATNVALVDEMIESMEANLLREYIEIERTPMLAAMAVSAMSQMWMFALYELLRTWRQRVNNLLKIHKEIGDVPSEQRAAALNRKAEKVRSANEDANPALEMHRGSIMQLEESGFPTRLEAALKVIEPVFRRIEALRMNLAKHEVPKATNTIAVAPGYGRIDLSTGSIYWQVDLKDDTVDIVNRREVADELRSLRF